MKLRQAKKIVKRGWAPTWPSLAKALKRVKRLPNRKDLIVSWITAPMQPRLCKVVWSHREIDLRTTRSDSLTRKSTHGRD